MLEQFVALARRGEVTPDAIPAHTGLSVAEAARPLEEPAAQGQLRRRDGANGPVYALPTPEAAADGPAVVEGPVHSARPPADDGAGRSARRPGRRAALARGLAFLILALAGIGVAARFVHWGALWAGVRAVTSSPEAFRVWIDGFGPWAPVAFFLAEGAQVIAAPIPGSVFPAVGAAAFGPEAALALTLGGAAAGSSVVFALARRWGRPLALKLVGQETFDRYIGLVGSRGGVWLFLVLLVPVLPGDAICALGGVSTISFPRFLIATTLGRLPGTALSVYLAFDLLERPAWVWLAAGLALLILLVLAIRFRARLEAWLLHRSRDPAARPPSLEAQTP